MLKGRLFQSEIVSVKNECLNDSQFLQLYKKELVFVFLWTSRVGHPIVCVKYAGLRWIFSNSVRSIFLNERL